MVDCAREDPCVCGGTLRRRWDLPPEVIPYGEPNITLPGINEAHGKRTPAQQEAVLRKLVAHERQVANDVRRARSGTRRGSCEMPKIGVIPRELYTAMQRTTKNKNYWLEGGKKALKRHGLLFDS